MTINWHDLRQAASDLGLQIFLTLTIVLILVFFAYLIHKSATDLNRRSQPNFPKQPRRHYTPLQLQRLSRKGQHPIPKQPPNDEAKQELIWRASYRQGISTELYGAVITTILLGLVVLIFAQYQDIQNQKASLIFQMGSPENAIAIEAVRQLRVEGWLNDGTLQRADLRSANLHDAALAWVDLRYANMGGVSLEAANFLRGDLRFVNLEGANLVNSDLREAFLSGANLQRANLESAMLPDGSVWTSDTDMTRFTNPQHPDSWKPCVELDPAPWYCED